jgi:hypothetical protein
MTHTSLTGRAVKCDATIISIDSDDIIALAMDATLTIDRETIEVTAPKDTWKQREQCGGADWSLQCGKLVASNIFGDTIIAGGAVVVSANIIGAGPETFYGVGFPTGYTHNWEDPQTESLTIIGNGAAPTIT